MSAYRLNQVHCAFLHTALDFWLLYIKIGSHKNKLCHKIQVHTFAELSEYELLQ